MFQAAAVDERLLLSSDQDVVCVLPTGYGKSLIYQLLGDLMPQRVTGSENIVVVVCPLNAIIEDQIRSINSFGISCTSLKFKSTREEVVSCDLFSKDKPPVGEKLNYGNDDDPVEENINVLDVPNSVLKGTCNILFAHPEAYMSDTGRKLLRSKTYRSRVVGVVIDEAHCVEIW